MRDRMQRSRFELKYIVNEDTAREIRRFLDGLREARIIDLDEFSAGQPDRSYTVHSIYLDSDTLKTYWDTINGNKNRFKLRIRFYDDKDNSPVFFEVKSRVNHCIFKQRGGVRKEMVMPDGTRRNWVQYYLSGHGVDPESLLSKTPKHQNALFRFCYLMQSIHAKPRVHIRYQREAYVSANDEFRVTLDRKVDGDANTDGTIRTKMLNPQRSFEDGVILELKFTNRFPNWYGDLVRRFNVMQCGAAKYVESIQALGSAAVGAILPVVDESLRRVRHRQVPPWVADARAPDYDD